jgi:hypothetical protein
LAEVDELTARMGEAEREEAGLVAELLSERARVGLAALYGDEAVIGRVVRAEGHLTRELERCLGLLARLRDGRRVREAADLPGSGAPPARGPAGVGGGPRVEFVL